MGSLSRAGLLNVAAIAVFAITIPLQIAGGIDYPTIPPGLIISIAVLAAITLGRRWKWTAPLGAIWPLFLTVGAIGADTTADALGSTGDTFVFLTTLVQVAALAVALLSGVTFAIQRLLGRTRVNG